MPTLDALLKPKKASAAHVFAGEVDGLVEDPIPRMASRSPRKSWCLISGRERLAVTIRRLSEVCSASRATVPDYLAARAW